jgi:hypothetical protein
VGVAEDLIWRNLQTFHELNEQLGAEGPVVGLEAVATRSNRDLLPVLPVVARNLC